METRRQPKAALTAIYKQLLG